LDSGYNPSQQKEELFSQMWKYTACSFRWFIVAESTVRWFVVREKHYWMAADSAE
jgi:hypothetical protein